MTFPPMKPLPIIITAVITVAGCLCFKTKADEPGNLYLHQADSFLAAMPENLQKHQAAAVRMAMAEKNGMLQQIRESRNTPPKLPNGVTITQISPNLTIFRSGPQPVSPPPQLIYLHGGGWAFGSINSCSVFCAALALNGITVMAVDYRLAPEHRFPTPLNDCISAVKTALGNLGKWQCNSISIGGDSAGGNLAISTALSFPENTFSTLVTFYPVTKAYTDNSYSWKQFSTGFGLDSELMEAFNQAYTDNPHNPLVSPAEASDTDLQKLPPTLIVAAERDILKDQGQAFATRLQKLGKEVEYSLIPGSVHLFITVDGQTAAFNHSVSIASRFITSHNPQATPQ